MQTQIASKGVDVSPALRERIEARLEDVMDKYIHREGEAQVAITREGTAFKVSCSLHLPSGALMQSQASAHDAYAAADEAMAHMEKRLRRYKRRLKDHHASHKQDIPPESLSLYVLENPVKGDDDAEEETEDSVESEAMVIAEKATPVRTMTVSMAALELGLTDSGALVFRNAGHGKLNVVFKRADGHIGWIDPERQI